MRSSYPKCLFIDYALQSISKAIQTGRFVNRSLKNPQGKRIIVIFHKIFGVNKIPKNVFDAILRLLKENLKGFGHEKGDEIL